jgi:fructose-bisphosphate aldolase class II
MAMALMHLKHGGHKLTEWAAMDKFKCLISKNLFNGHMYDGSDLPLDENMKHAVPLLELCHQNEIILGGEEDGINREGVDKEKLYTTPEDMLAVYEALCQVKGARYMLAATFGSVHGVYKPGNVVLTPEILQKGQDAVTAKHGDGARFWLVFYGGSGSELADIHKTLDYVVIKMNVHMMRNYDAVLKIDGEVGDKKAYDPRAWLKAGRENMAARVVRACEDLKSAGRSLGR